LGQDARVSSEYSELVFRGLPRVWRTNRFRIALRKLEQFGARDRTVVDFGCADGYGIPLWSRVAKRVIGVDIDDVRLADAKRKYGMLRNVEFVRSSEFDFQGDIMLALEVLEHTDGVPESLAILRRFLSTTDRIVFATLPLEVGLPLHFKRVAARAFPRLCMLHGPTGYDYRPLLFALDSDPSLSLECVRFEPLAVLGAAFNRGLCITLRRRGSP